MTKRELIGHLLASDQLKWEGHDKSGIRGIAGKYSQPDRERERASPGSGGRRAQAGSSARRENRPTWSRCVQGTRDQTSPSAQSTYRRSLIGSSKERRGL